MIIKKMNYKNYKEKFKFMKIIKNAQKMKIKN